VKENQHKIFRMASLLVSVWGKNEKRILIKGYPQGRKGGRNKKFLDAHIVR